jgi:hypothetical protein
VFEFTSDTSFVRYGGKLSKINQSLHTEAATWQDLLDGFFVAYKNVLKDIKMNDNRHENIKDMRRS